jgi:hypothetical protein
VRVEGGSDGKHPYFVATNLVPDWCF